MPKQSTKVQYATCAVSLLLLLLLLLKSEYDDAAIDADVVFFGFCFLVAQIQREIKNLKAN